MHEGCSGFLKHVGSFMRFFRSSIDTLLSYEELETSSVGSSSINKSFYGISSLAKTILPPLNW